MPAKRCPKPDCDFFNRPLPNNADVCPGCGTPLGNVVSHTPTPIPIQATPTQRPTPPTPIDDVTNYQPRPPIQPIQPSYPPQPPKLPLLKLIHTSRREFQWSGETFIIGRRSQNMTLPEIEITGIPGIPDERVVSRHHARVSWDWSQSAYMIIDISTNGIYLNGNPLTPGVPYRLINGDTLQLGQDNLVRFTVYLV